MVKHDTPDFDRVNITKSTTAMTAQEEKSKDSATTVERPDFKTTKDIGSVKFSEPLTTNRPKNVYIELINGKYWLWYNTEKSDEIGIKRNYVENPMTHIKSEIGYDCDIPATSANIALVKEIDFPGTQYIFKDSVRRTVIDVDIFVKNNQL